MVVVQAEIGGSRVVATQPGAGTGETIYITADGRTWQSPVPLKYGKGTGDVVEQIRYTKEPPGYGE